ncbi:hypothetical protein MICAC_2650002 [Microcystis aeruginosa PCC 9443]|uniref:Uncharacterized protein n=1 Tax=Microcystis aeruginosa PCC 9443 TaxID=1160281 RepID=I4G1L6_MICAE|nr:hypothetical protein MICAC_2650002 [Microcystis aeruginosa PCC 9443]
MRLSLRSCLSNDLENMNTKAIKEIEINGLKPKQMEQIKAMIADFKRQNQPLKLNKKTKRVRWTMHTLQT